MIRTRFGLLGLCAVLFGVMAFGATAAHAEKGAQWLFAEKGAGTKLVAFLEAKVGLEAEENVVLVLHTEILKLKVLFLCTAVKAVNAVLKANGSIGEGAKLLFSGCTTDLGGEPAPECTPKDKEDGEAGTIVTKPGHGLIELHELAGGVKDDIVRILPDNVGGKPSEVFATLELGPECSIGTKVNVIGKATLKDCEGLFLEHLVKHLVETGPLTELWTISKTAEHVATILGSVWAFLEGEHEKLKWSGDPA